MLKPLFNCTVDARLLSEVAMLSHCCTAWLGKPSVYCAAVQQQSTGRAYPSSPPRVPTRPTVVYTRPDTELIPAVVACDYKLVATQLLQGLSISRLHTKLSCRRHCLLTHTNVHPAAQSLQMPDLWCPGNRRSVTANVSG
jgi:hypothetical protein